MFLAAYPVGIFSQLIVSTAVFNSSKANFSGDHLYEYTYIFAHSADVWLLFCGVFVYVGYVFIKAFPAIWKYIQKEDPASSGWEQKFTTFGNKLVIAGISIGFALSLCRIVVAVILK